jgi:hypothetical protein
VTRVLAWADARQSLAQKARAERISLALLVGCIRRQGRYQQPGPDGDQRLRVAGRPRVLTDGQVRRILKWHLSRKSVKDIARELGVCTTTIATCIRNRGAYKLPSAEVRRDVLSSRRVRYRALKARAWI